MNRQPRAARGPAPIDVPALVARAKAEGRHADTWVRVCQGCGREVVCGPGRVGIAALTLDRKGLCKACAVRMGLWK